MLLLYARKISDWNGQWFALVAIDYTKGESMQTTIIKPVRSALYYTIWIKGILGYIHLIPRLKKLYHSKHQSSSPR